MKKFLKVLGIIILVLGLAVLALAYGGPKYTEYTANKEKQKRAQEKEEVLSTISYTIPKEFRLPTEGDRGNGYIDYIYEENNMIAQIRFEVISKERWLWAQTVDDVIDYLVRDEDTIIEGPSVVDLNGLKATKVVITSTIDFDLSGKDLNSLAGELGEETVDDSAFESFSFHTHLGSVTYDYVADMSDLGMDQYYIVIEYNIIDEETERDDADTNRCVTLYNEFISSISAK